MGTIVEFWVFYAVLSSNLNEVGEGVMGDRKGENLL